MSWLVVGARGMLGQDIVAALIGLGRDVIAYDRDELDITQPDAVDEAIASLRPAVIVNCAAWTAVDDAESKERDAFTLSACGAGYLARAAHTVGARMIQISTDYVFSGDAATPYGENSPLAPVSAYGRTKAAGEWAVRSECPDSMIVRTAWLYGANGSSFPRTIARAGRTKDRLDVVSDQVGQPTWTMDLADLIIRLVDAEAPAGIYHGTSGGSCSWYEFAQRVVSADGQDGSKVKPTTSEQFVRAAQRPSYSVLGHDALLRIGVDPIGAWQERWDLAAREVLA